MQPLFQVHLHRGLTTGKERFSCFPLYLKLLKELSLLTVFTSIFFQTHHYQAFLTLIGTIIPIHQMLLLSFCYWTFITFFPGVGNGTALWYSCLEKSHGQRSLVGYSPWAGHHSRPSTSNLPASLIALPSKYPQNMTNSHQVHSYHLIQGTWMIAIILFFCFICGSTQPVLNTASEEL